MRITVGSLVLCLLAGCALTPPKPQQCEGEFRPVNAPAAQAVSLNAAQSQALCMKGRSNGYEG